MVFGWHLLGTSMAGIVPKDLASNFMSIILRNFPHDSISGVVIPPFTAEIELREV